MPGRAKWRVQAFCEAKPWRRRDLLPPSISNDRGPHGTRAFRGECARVLRTAGAAEVLCATLARAR